ncbi:MAG: flagellar motor switch protein FliM [Oscillospiraceae bacterium]
MPDKLSQAQIDALLNRMNSGEAVEEEESEQKPIKEYDFRSPKKFTKEQLRTLDSMHENFSRMLSSYLSGMLRVFSEVSVLAIEEQRYFEFNNALPDTALVGILDMKPKEDKYSEATLLMNMSTAIGYFMVDRLLGGSGEGYNISRDFTEIELSILNNIFSKLLIYLKEAWCSYIDVDIKLSSIQTNARLLQALAPEDIVVIVVLNVKIKNLTGTINICVPAANLEEMIDNFSVKYMRTSGKRQNTEKLVEERKKLIFTSLEGSDLEMKAVLANTQLELKDILQMETGDIIPLNKSISDTVDIIVDDTKWFTANLGERKNKKAVKLNEVNTFK